ncbi:MAG TPA: oxygenase MpaB family protein, partial [Candidatus Dormibacteraeota bacterium]|nr:oxygenase MpaB family protein [Candidatus Dormibacteraeota bacterium]
METARVNALKQLGRAYVRAVPEHPADDGLFGPGSVVWRVNRDRCFPLAGMRSLMVQALHPLAMAGVAQHSTWKQDP